MNAGLGRPSWPTIRISDSGEAEVNEVSTCFTPAPKAGRLRASEPSQRMSLSMVWVSKEQPYGSMTVG